VCAIKLLMTAVPGYTDVFPATLTMLAIRPHLARATEVLFNSGSLTISKNKAPSASWLIIAASIHVIYYMCTGVRYVNKSTAAVFFFAAI
jgi:hypothetical protein